MTPRDSHASEEPPANNGPDRPPRPHPHGRTTGGGSFNKPRNRWPGKPTPSAPAGPRKGFASHSPRPVVPHQHKKAQWVSKKEQEKKEAIFHAERLIRTLDAQGYLPPPAPGNGWYPRDPDGPLCPVLRHPDTLWGLIYADRVRHRELLSLALEFSRIPEEVETSRDQDRLLALRMLDLPHGRRWLAEHEKPSLLVSLHNAILRLFLQADRAAHDPFFDVTRVLRSSEIRDGQTSRSVLSLDRWRMVLEEVPHLKRKDARAFALWACAFAMRQPADADAILDALVRAGGELFAAWFTARKKKTSGPNAASALLDLNALGLGDEDEEETEDWRPETGDKTASAPTAIAPAIIPAPKPHTPSDLPTTAVAFPARAPAEAVHRAPAQDPPGVVAESVGSDGSGGSVSSVPSVLSVPSVPSPPAASGEDSLSAAWSRAVELASRCAGQPDFAGLTSLRAAIAHLLDARQREFDRVADLAGACRFEFPRHPDAAALDPVALRAEAEALATPEALIDWVRGVEIRVRRIRVDAGQAARIRELLEPALAPIQELAKAGYVSGALHERYDRLVKRLLQTPPVGIDPTDFEPWAGLGAELIKLEKGIASMAQALPGDVSRYDDNMRAFLRAADVLRSWCEKNWMSPPALNRARALFEHMALPKFSWQPTARLLEEEGFARGD